MTQNQNKMKKNVLSLFDGMACAKLALDEAGIEIDNYYCSEVDKHAVKLTAEKWPNHIQLGDVRNIDTYTLPEIWLLCGGSPCQSFSFAGKMKGMATKCEKEITELDQYLKLKSEGFEFEGQSYLFWEFVRILQEVKPKYFLLENVQMVTKWERVITKALGIPAININSSLVSAQNRDRLYWTNINTAPQGLFGDVECIIPQPQDRGIVLKDILQENVPEKYYLKNTKFGFNGLDLEGKSNSVRVGGQGTQTKKHNWDLVKVDKDLNIKPNQEKASCFTAGGHSGGNHSDMDLIVQREVIQLNQDKSSNNGTQPYQQDRVYDVNGISPALCKDKSDLIIKENYVQWDLNGKGNESQDQRAFFENGKSGTVDTGASSKMKVILSQQERLLERTGVDISGVTEPTILDVYNKRLVGSEKTPTVIDERHGSTSLVLPEATKKGYVEIEPGECFDAEQIGSKTRRGRKMENKSNSLMSAQNSFMQYTQDYRIRRLTPIEVCRLQTVPDQYFYDNNGNQIVSDSQIYKMCGNGWTVSVIAHIFSFIDKNA